MKGHELIGALTELYRGNGKANDTVVVETGGAYTMTVDRVEQRGRTTVVVLKRLIHK